MLLIFLEFKSTAKYIIAKNIKGIAPLAVYRYSSNFKKELFS